MTYLTTASLRQARLAAVPLTLVLQQLTACEMWGQPPSLAGLGLLVEEMQKSIGHSQELVLLLAEMQAEGLKSENGAAYPPTRENAKEKAND